MLSTLRPTVSLQNLEQVDAEAFMDFLPEDTRAVTWDLDGTLADHYEEQVPEAHVALLQGLTRLDVWLGIISNAGSEARTRRVQRIAAVLAHAAGQNIYVVTSRMVGGAKKPLRPIFDRMADNMQIPASQIGHVGDQLLKDVLGANRAGYGGTVLVAKYGQDDDRKVKYLQRPIEAALRPLVGASFT